MGKYFQEDIETASREQINQWQNDGLLDVVKRVYENVPFYRKKMEAVGVTPDDIKSIDDISKLPFLTKDDLRDAYPYDLMALPLKDCVRIHSTSGTTGKRVVDFYTHGDIDKWENGCARVNCCRRWFRRRCSSRFIRLWTFYRWCWIKRWFS